MDFMSSFHGLPIYIVQHAAADRCSSTPNSVVIWSWQENEGGTVRRGYQYITI